MLPTDVLRIFWWVGYTVVAVWLHRLAPGVDFFAPGVIVALQKERLHEAFLLACIWILLQEGVGSLPFGYGIAWYALLMVMYLAGRWLFEARSFLFMCLLGIGLGLLHPLLTFFLSALAGLVVDLKLMAIEGAAQAVVFPVVWFTVDQLYPKRFIKDVRSL